MRAMCMECNSHQLVSVVVLHILIHQGMGDANIT